MMRPSALAILLLAASVAHATPPGNERKIAGGAKAMLNLSTVDSGRVADGDARMGFGVGGFVTFRVNRNFSLQAELLYMQKGGSVGFTDIFLSDDVPLTLDYIEVPMFAVVRLPHRGFEASLFVGAYAGVLASATLDSEIVTSQVEWFDAGATFGAAMSVEAGPGELAISARYSRGLRNVDLDSDLGYGSTIYGAVSVNVQVFSIGASYAY